ncbi:MAG: hypothetical protein ABWU16_04930 [Halothiobacillaceae bacterium]
MQESFGEFALLLLIAAAVGAVATRLKQPMLIAYIVVGILIRPLARRVRTPLSPPRTRR